MSDSFVHFLSAVMYPLNNIATRLQVQNTGGGGREYSGTLDACRRLVREGGLASLYRQRNFDNSGFSSGILGVAVSQGVFYYSYEVIRDAFSGGMSGPKRVFTNLDNLAIGAVAGIITAVATNPIWVINTRMTTIKANSPDHAKSSVAVAFDIARTEAAFLKMVGTEDATTRINFHYSGPWALFKGVVPGLILVTNPAIQYMVFERLRSAVELRRTTKSAVGKLTDMDFFWLGLLSKFVASTVTYPLILVKSKMQAKQNDKAPRYSGTWQALLKILGEDGVAGLFQGYGPRIIQSVLTSAILFLAKEKLFLYTVALLSLRKGAADLPSKKVVGGTR